MRMHIPVEARQGLALLKELPGVSLAGVYLHGSAAMGGLQRDSDVDVLAALGSGLPELSRKRLTDGLLLLSGKPGSGSAARPLEVIAVNLPDLVPWRYPPRREYLYGEWLREGFRRGEVPEPADDPDLALILAQAMQHSVPLTGPDITDILPPIPPSDVRAAMRDSLPGLMASVWGDERNVLLTLARMWYTAETGGFAAKDAAARWALPRLPEDGAALLDTAARAYRGETADHWAGRGPEVAALARELAEAVTSCLRRSGNSG